MTSPTRLTPFQEAQLKITQQRASRNAWDKPWWQQTDEEQQQRLGAAPIVTVPQAQANVNSDTWDKQLQASDDASQIATQGVLGSVQTQKQRQAELDLAKWKQAQQNSYASLVDQYNQRIGDMQNGYMSQFGQYTAGVGTQAGQYKFSNNTDNQIAAWARQAGWAEKDIPMVVQIAQAESARNPLATNTSNRNGSADYGLMQINTIHRGSLGNSFFEGGGWKDPVTNLKAALGIYRDAGNKWTPWATYTNGAYQQYQPSFSVATVSTGPTLTNTSTGLRANVISEANRYILNNVPYVYAGNDMSGVDCSGLVHAVYSKLGIATPRTANDYANTGAYGSTSYGGNTKISGSLTSNLSSLRPGDLVVWKGQGIGYWGPNVFGHVAIYAGNGQIIEAATQGTTVRRVALSGRMQGTVMGVRLNLPGD